MLDKTCLVLLSGKHLSFPVIIIGNGLIRTG